MNNEEKFVKMMGANINCWMSSYYTALPFIAELVIDGKVELKPDTDLDQLSNDLAEKYFVFDSDTFSTVLSCFSSLSQNLTFDVLDGLGIQLDNLWDNALSPQQLEEIFLNNPKKSAELILKAQKEYQPIYN
jgi:RNAse (barnase) inhibitor barstar